MNPDNEFCDSEGFMTAFNRQEKDKDTIFGKRESDFDPKRIAKIEGPIEDDGDIDTQQTTSEGFYHGIQITM